MVERNGPHGAAGAATAALFLGAVTAELASPWLMSRMRSARMLVAGLLLTALPSLVYGLPHPAVWEMIGAAAIRGLGMGMAIVVSVALLSDLSAPGRRGASFGLFSLALGAPGIVVSSLGVVLLSRGRPDLDALIAFGSGLLGAILALRVSNRQPHVATGSTNLLDAVQRPGLLLVFGAFVLASCSFGGVVTYAPIALPLGGLGSAATFLLVFGGARAASRWLAGVLGDRMSTRTLLAASLAAALAGLTSLALHGSALTVLLAAVLYGIGYGATQTAAFLAMTERGTAADSGPVSALWNAGTDLGASLGGTLVGLTAAKVGYINAVWALPVVMAIALPLFLWHSVPKRAAAAS